MATDPGSVPIDRVNAAAALAGHDPRGARLLASYARDSSFPVQLRIAAAGHLAHVGRAAGIALLIPFAGDTASRYCSHAAARLAEHDTPAGVARLRSLVADPHCPDLAKVEAAVVLSGHDRAAGTEWLGRFAADSRVFADCRVYAADALAAAADGDQQTRATATMLLERIAGDTRVDTGYRVEAAHRLARYDTDVGAAILRDLACGSLPARYRCDAAVLLARHDREAGVRILDEMTRAAGGTPEHRVRAADELAHYAPAEGDARLAALAGEPGWDDGPRIEAAFRLARRNREAGLPLLRAYATELTGEARVTGASALARVDRAEGLELLREMAESPGSDRSVRVRAARAIGTFDAELRDATLRRLGVDIQPGGWFRM